MIDNENLINLYEGIIKGEELTTKQLKEYGFNSKDLNDLIEKKVLERTKRGYYTLIDIDNFYLYGKKLISTKEYSKSNACFEACYKLDQTNKGVNFQLFIRSIKNKDYQKALEHFDKFYINEEDEYVIADNNFYLYLLSMIADLPDNYQQLAKKLNFDDVKVSKDDRRYSEPYSENRIRTSAFNQTFPLAIKQLSDKIDQKGELLEQDFAIKILLIQAAARQNNIEQSILSFIKEKEYSKLIEYLKNKESKVYLSLKECTIMQLVMDLDYMLETRIIPEKINCSNANVSEAISNFDYESAISLSYEHSKKYNKAVSGDAIYLLLYEINDFINKEELHVKKKVMQTKNIL